VPHGPAINGGLLAPEGGSLSLGNIYETILVTKSTSATDWNQVYQGRYEPAD